jgi:hypothetical protein
LISGPQPANTITTETSATTENSFDQRDVRTGDASSFWRGPNLLIPAPYIPNPAGVDPCGDLRPQLPRLLR